MSNSISEITEIWQKTLKIIEKKIDDKNAFDSFFESAYIDDISDGTVYLTTNSNVAVRVLSTNFKKLVLDSIYEVCGEKYNLVVSNIKQIKDKAKKEVLSTPKKVETRLIFKDADVNKNLTFENYIVGDFNKLAARAAHAVAENPGKKFNPLFLHSNSGLGKTHLLHAIGNYAIEHIDKVKVLYMHSNVFVDEYIKYVTGDKTQTDLKDELSSADILLFDDVQLLAEKVKSQEMFFTIYEKLIQKGKQIVVASDRHPDELKGVDDRLVTRLSQGIVVEINKPDVESCIKILRLGLEKNGINANKIDDEVLRFFAEKNSSNIRRLEGAINGLINTAELLGEEEHVTMDVAISSTTNYLRHKNLSAELNERKIINAVSDYYKIPVNSLVGDSREGPIAKARHVAIYLIYTLIKDIPLKKIGEAFGGKDHSTIKYSVEKIEKELKTNKNLENSISEIKRVLNKSN